MLRPSSTLRLTSSTLGRMLDELRRRCRVSQGSPGRRPPARASKFSVSVRLTTPESRPDTPAPDMEAARLVSLPDCERARPVAELAELGAGR